MTQYAKIARQYTDGTKMQHPQRKYMIYATWLEVCGNIRGLNVLDVGCGGGDSSRLLARKGARVTGIDKEIQMLKVAREKELANPLGIEYLYTTAENLPVFKHSFDLVTPAYLLHYAKSKNALNNMFIGIANNLPLGGRLVGICPDPERPVIDYFPGICSDVRWLGTPWEEGSETEVTYRNKEGEKVLSFRNCYWWKKETYEMLLRKAGFSEINWLQPKMNEEGKRLFPNWKKLEDYCVVILSATKTRS